MVTKKEYPNINFTSTAVNDKTNPALLADVNAASKATGVLATISIAKTGHNVNTKSGNLSRHSTNQAVDLSVLNNAGCKNCTEKTITTSFSNDGDKIVNYLVKNCGYTRGESTDKGVLWKVDDHWNHIHVSNKSTTPGCKVKTKTSDDETPDETPEDEEDEPSLVTSLLQAAGFNENDESNNSIETITEEINRIKILMK